MPIFKFFFSISTENRLQTVVLRYNYFTRPADVINDVFKHLVLSISQISFDAFNGRCFLDKRVILDTDNEQSNFICQLIIHFILTLLFTKYTEYVETGV